MYSRFALFNVMEKVLERFEAHQKEKAELRASFNVAPTTPVAAIVAVDG
jgi:putative SOS response-associated peptidase YedK